jgi:hypothetical protein
MGVYAGQDVYKLNGTHLLLVCTEDDLVVEDNHMMKKSTEAL